MLNEKLYLTEKVGAVDPIHPEVTVHVSYTEPDTDNPHALPAFRVSVETPCAQFAFYADEDTYKRITQMFRVAGEEASL